MKYLMDTHVLLWLITDSPRIQVIRDAVEDPVNDIFYSSASVWEIAIKYHLGKLPVSPAEASEEFKKAGFSELKITADHAIATESLNEPESGHRDPFDRMLIAQAKTEQMFLVTADEKIAAFPEPCIRKIM